MQGLLKVFLFGLMSLFIFYLWKSCLKGRQFMRRVQNFIGRRLDVFEQVEESDEDEGIVDDEFLFSDQNPELSVERYRRMRFDAAAAALRNTGYKHSSTETNGNYEMYQGVARTP